MSDYTVQYDADGHILIIKNMTADKRIRHARAGDRVMFEIPNTTNFAGLLIQNSAGENDSRLFGYDRVGFGSEYDIKSGAPEGKYTFTPYTDTPHPQGTVSPPETGAIYVEQAPGR